MRVDDTQHAARLLQADPSWVSDGRPLLGAFLLRKSVTDDWRIRLRDIGLNSWGLSAIRPMLCKPASVLAASPYPTIRPMSRNGRLARVNVGVARLAVAAASPERPLVSHTNLEAARLLIRHLRITRSSEPGDKPSQRNSIGPRRVVGFLSCASHT